MEKLAYLVWKRPQDGASDFATRLLREVAPRLHARCDGLRVSVVDDEVAAAKLHLGKLAPAGLVSFWLEQSQERGACESLLERACERLAGYLVVESRPLVNRAQRAPTGGRTPGFALVSCIEAKDGLSKAEFIERWYTLQRDMAIEVQSTFGYVRNEVVRALTPEAPPWDAIVEENFPIGALTDPAVFYDAVGDPERLAQHQRRMFEAVQQFIALDRIESHPMSEYDFSS